MFLITLLFKRMPVEPKPRKWLYFKGDFMPPPNACRQKQQMHLCSKTLRNTLTGVQFLIKLQLSATLLQMNSCFFKVSDHSTESEAYSKPCQISKMECFARIFISFQPLTCFAKRSVLDIQQRSEYASGIASIFSFQVLLLLKNFV